MFGPDVGRTEFRPGTVQVGQTLTADVSSIADADGLTSSTYNYQWLADDTEIDEATSSIYTLQASDNGKVIDARTRESLTSDGTSTMVRGGL